MLTYLIFAAIVLFVVLPIVFRQEDKRFKNVQFDQHVREAIAITIE